jgi:ABC-type transporter Mla subunit MlaD
MAEDLQSLQKQIEQLRKEIKNLGGETFKDMDAAIKAFGGGVDGAKKLINSMNKDVEDLRDTFGAISSTLKNIVQDLKGASDPVKETTKSFDKLESLARKISYHRKGEEVLTVKQLKTIQKQTAAEVTRLKENQKLLDKNSDAYKEVTDALNEKNGLLKDINEQVGAELETEKKIQKTLGVTGGLFKGITKSLEHIGIESEHFEKINEDLRKVAKTGTGFQVLGAGIKGIGSSLATAFKDPLVQVAALGKLLHSIVEFANEFDHETVAIQKNLGISHEAAFEMNKELEHMAIHMGRTHKDVVAANSEINSFLGTSIALSEKQLQDQVALTKNAGLEADERANIMKFSLLTGESQEEIFDSIGKQNKGVLSNKKVLSEVLKTSGQLSAQYKNNPNLLGKAVTQAQKLGMTLEQTKKISQGLLNFEDSISAELEAELLTGQDLNLEKARYLALQGDSAGAAAELMKNLGPNGLAKFQKMNVIQQEAYAKALGMSADELADSLVKQKQLDSLDKQEAAALKKRVEELKSSGQIEKATELEKQTLKNKSLALAEQEMANSEKMAESAEKLKQSFMQFMVGPVSKAMNFFSGVIETISSSKILSALVGGVGLAATAAGILMVGKSIINSFRGKKGDSPNNPSYVEVVGGGAGGDMGGDLAGELSDSLGGGKKASVGKQLKTLFKKPKVMMRALSRKGGGSLIKGLGKGLGKANIASLLGGFALDATAASQLEKAQELEEQGKKEEAKKAKNLGKGLDVGSSALTGAGLGATVGSIIPGVGTAIGGAVGGLLGAGYGAYQNYFGGDEPELAVGGIVTKPTRALVGEAGAEAVIPLDKFYAKLDELISVVKAGGHVYLDGNKVGTAMSLSTFKTQ